MGTRQSGERRAINRERRTDDYARTMQRRTARAIKHNHDGSARLTRARRISAKGMI